MGGKQRKNRKHLLFFIACFLIIFIIGGCIIPPKRAHVLPAGGTPFERAVILVSKGRYDDALNAFNKIARTYSREAPGDKALFEMGLIWAYPDNPKKDYNESLICFNRLLRDYPNSALKREAGAWREVLTMLTQYDGQIKDLEDKVNSYTEQINAMKEIDIGIEEKKRKGLPEE
jgi:tetratricopeptide (TPR) repeat protein